MIEYIEPLLEGIEDLISNPGMILMWIISGILYYFGIYKKKEPLLLVPISTGILLANLPMGELLRIGGNGEPDGFLRIFQNIGMSNDVLPLLIFLGMGALTDFEPVLSNPKTLLLGAAAQVGVFVALIGALLISLTPFFDFGLLEASSIGIIGGADGPTTIFISTRMREIGLSLSSYEMKDIVGATAVAAYSYMALVPIIQPPIIRLFTTQKERKIRMEYSSNKISKKTKIIFPVITIIIVSILVPDASPLISIMMFGNLLRESGVVDRLAKTAQNELMNIVIILLGLSVGATMPAKVFLKVETISIFILGLVSFILATISGILLAKIMNIFLKKPINPMIGAAGVSAVPMAARVVQNEAAKEDPDNYLLMHAMGPNVAGVIGTATVAGVLLAVVPQLVS
ncbi:MAG: glutaconyl-CoA decarboxylase subunit beta [Chloroflexi bacterium]|jgi:sodium ion-translocating decarboxylase beta subunit|nr:MAG: sodium ion-translocating decarboxylase subunit beta [SAR202 cluster bacterium]MAX11973.1 glutaconyl-CoA decarboxylase subunit beta [Chloroflexota bacterium]|tara:strand:- start:2584 stop:3783 length:1200 start_codon:yes stop_codon:yes gene_type:complete